MPRIVKLILAAVVSGIALAGAALLVNLFVLDGDDYVDLAWRLEVQGSVSVDGSLTVALTGQKVVLTRGQTRLAEARQARLRLELPASMSSRSTSSAPTGKWFSGLPGSTCHIFA